MTFIETIPDEQASGLLAELYDEERADDGYVWNGTKAFSHRPEVRAGWKRFMGSIAANMDHRRYELATLAAARRLRSSYCMLAHGSVVLERYLAPEALRAVATDHRAAGLDPVDVAVMDFAEKVAGDATGVTQEDVDGLREARPFGCGHHRRRVRRGRAVLHEQGGRRARRAARPRLRGAPRAGAARGADRGAPDRGGLAPR